MKGLMLLPLLAVLVVSVCYVEASPAVERDAEETLLNLLARVLDDQDSKSTKESEMKKKDQGAAKEEQMKKDGHPGQLVENAQNGMENILEERQEATYELQLVDGKKPYYEGRVEVSRMGSVWGTICGDDGWGYEEAYVVCRQLGFPYTAAFPYTSYTVLWGLGVATAPTRFGPGSGSIFLEDVVCTGDETNLASCSSKGWGISSCKHVHDVGVRCRGIIGSAPDGGLRLAGGYDACGRVEVFYNGEWGSICDDFWDDADAKVVCRQLGLPYTNARSGSVWTNDYYATYGKGSGEIWLDDVSCDGDEERLDQCGRRNNLWGSHDCRSDHRDDALVFCA